MNCRILLGVCLLAASAKYVDSEGFLIYVQKWFPEVPGTCFYVTCEKSSNQGENFNCTKKYTAKDGNIGQIHCGLKKSDRGPNDYDMTDGHGTLTGKTGTLIIKDDIFAFEGKDKGVTDNVICGTYKSTLDAATSAKLAAICNFKDVKINDVVNKNC